MADNWEVGDLALCVSEAEGGVPSPWEPAIGGCYRVVDVCPCEEDDGTAWVGLDFEEDPFRDPWACFDAVHFRKLDNHTPDAEDEETIRLLKGEPCNPPSHTVPSEQENACG